MARIKVSNGGHSKAPSDHIPRPRLLKLLRSSTRPVLWLTGPFGSGKSVLARDYCISSDQPAVWYHFDEFNGSTQSFLEQVATIHVDPWILCLDGYQLLSEKSELHDILVDLATNAENLLLKIIVTSRTPPPAQWFTPSVNRQIDVFTDFNFDLRELSRIATSYRGIAEATDEWLGELHQHTEGWPAGVILLLERLCLGLDDGLPLSDVGLQVTSDYFLSNLFRTLPEHTRQRLLRSGLLPFLPADQVDAIVGIPESRAELDQLCNDRVFTTRELRNSGAGIDEEARYLVYRHQGLFREFLRQNANLELSREERMSVALRGATVLAQSGEFTVAVDVYIEYAAWDEISSLVLNSSLQLLQSGQISKLYQVFSRLPSRLVDSNPDLLFWYGVCETSLGHTEAREHLSMAYSLYKEQGNVIGMAISWRAVVDAIWLRWEGLDELAFWLAEYDARAAQEYQTLPEPFQGGLMMSRFGVLSFCSPEHPEMKQLEQSVAEHAHTPMPSQERALLFVKILYHFTYGTGNRSQTDFYLNLMRTLAQQVSASPLDRILRHNFEAAYQYCFVGSPDKCYEHVDEALKIGKDSGILVWQTVSSTHALYMALGQGDQRRAQTYLTHFKRTIDLNNAMHVAFDELFSGWFAMLQGRYPSAMRHVNAGLALLDRNPVPMIRNLFLGGKIALLVQQRGWKEAWLELSKIRQYARATRSNTLEIMVRLQQANWCLKRRRNWAARAFLQRARDIGVKQNIFVCPWLTPGQLQELVAFAIESGIDHAYFSRWVSLYSLKSPAEFTARYRWPWRIRIHTLGALEIHRDDQILNSQGRAHKRLFELLGVLVTAGPNGKPQDEVMSELWPDKSEEKGRSNLNTNLARLRSLLGDPAAVISSEGRIYVSQDRCWVDSWEFMTASDISFEKDIDELRMMEGIYRGEYRVPETSGSSEMILRSTMARRYLKVARSLVGALEAGPEIHQAIDIYRNMLNKLEPEESIFRDMMRCYAKMDRLHEVTAIYSECERVLAEKYEASPSDVTARLYQRLLN